MVLYEIYREDGGNGIIFVHTSVPKKDGFNFVIVNFPHLDNDITTAPVYAVYISQFVRSAPLKLAVCIQTFYHVTVLCTLNF
jgi:hypothetical protein